MLTQEKCDALRRMWESYKPFLASREVLSELMPMNPAFRWDADYELWCKLVFGCIHPIEVLATVPIELVDVEKIDQDVLIAAHRILGVCGARYVGRSKDAIGKRANFHHRQKLCQLILCEVLELKFGFSQEIFKNL